MTSRPLPTDIGAERLIELFDAAPTTKAYGVALSLMADCGRFTPPNAATWRAPWCGAGQGWRSYDA
jgi:hypothetical protein